MHFPPAPAAPNSKGCVTPSPPGPPLCPTPPQAPRRRLGTAADPRHSTRRGSYRQVGAVGVPLGDSADDPGPPAPALRRLLAAAADAQKPLPHQLRPRLHRHRHGRRRASTAPAAEPAPLRAAHGRNGAERRQARSSRPQRRAGSAPLGRAGAAGPLRRCRQQPDTNTEGRGRAGGARSLPPSLPPLPLSHARAPSGSLAARSPPRCGPDHSAPAAHCHGDQHRAPSPSAGQRTVRGRRPPPPRGKESSRPLPGPPQELLPADDSVRRRSPPAGDPRALPPPRPSRAAEKCVSHLPPAPPAPGPAAGESSSAEIRSLTLSIPLLRRGFGRFPQLPRDCPGPAGVSSLPKVRGSGRCNCWDRYHEPGTAQRRVRTRSALCSTFILSLTS